MVIGNIFHRLFLFLLDLSFHSFLHDFNRTVEYKKKEEKIIVLGGFLIKNRLSKKKGKRVE